jgi:Zn-dependent peptidase ImmA (M78 family)
MKIDTPANFVRNHPDKQEREANEFAMALLMPQIAVEHVILKEGMTNIKEIASLFQVSEVMVLERLKMLNLI